MQNNHKQLLKTLIKANAKDELAQSLTSLSPSIKGTCILTKVGALNFSVFGILIFAGTLGQNNNQKPRKSYKS